MSDKRIVEGVAYDRVSAIASCLPSDMFYAGADMASRGAVRIATDVIKKRIEVESIKEWLMSDSFYKWTKSEATRQKQATADRGTIVGWLFDAIVTGGAMSPEDIADWLQGVFDQRPEEAAMRYDQWDEAAEMGLVMGEDKPRRGWQCTFEEVLPYAAQLGAWFDTGPELVIKTLQPQLVCKKSRVAGRPDFLGTWNGIKVVGDLKTSSCAQPSRYHRCQLSKYAGMARTNGMNIIVTPTSVWVRVLSPEGKRNGLLDFRLAHAIYKGDSMKGSYFTNATSKKVSA